MFRLRGIFSVLAALLVVLLGSAPAVATPVAAPVAGFRDRLGNAAEKIYPVQTINAAWCVRTSKTEACEARCMKNGVRNYVSRCPPLPPPLPPPQNTHWKYTTVNTSETCLTSVQASWVCVDAHCDRQIPFGKCSSDFTQYNFQWKQRMLRPAF